MLKAVIFDWYGTIGEIKGSNPRKEILSEYGLSKELYDKMNIDLFLTPAIDRNYVQNRLCSMIQVPPTSENVNDILERLRRQNDIETYEEAFTVVPKLRSDLNVKFGLLTNMDAVIMRSLIENRHYHTFYMRYFDKLFFSCKYGLCKPDLEFFNAALRELGAPAEESLMIGDKEKYDLQPARTLGMQTFKVRMKDRVPMEKTLADLHDFISSNFTLSDSM